MRSPNTFCLFHFLRFCSLIVLLFSSLAFSQTPPWGKAVSFGGTGSDWGSVVKVDRKSNKYVAGYFSGTVTFGTQTLTSDGNESAYIMKFASDGTFAWVVQIGSSDYDEAFDIGFDGSENVLVSGTFLGDASFGSIGGTPKLVSNPGQSIFLAKYDPDGKLVWVQTGISDDNSDPNEGFGVAVNPASGIIYLTGRASGSLTFSSSNGTSHTLSGVGFWHGYLAKYDSSGNYQWGEVNSSGPNSIAHKVAIDSDNNAYMVGWFERGVTFKSRDGKSQTVQAYSQLDGPDFPDDAFLTKYNSHGDLQWIDHIGGYKGIANDVAASPSGNVTLAGFVGNLDTGDSRAETIVSSQPPGSSVNLGGGTYTDPYNPDIVVATYDPTGVLLSVSRIGGAQNDVGSSIAYDSTGNLYMAALFAGTFSVGGTTVTGNMPSNLLVTKWTGDTLDWAKVAPGLAEQTFENDPRLAVNSATGKVFIEGSFQGTGRVGNTILTSAGSDDIFLVYIPGGSID